MKQRTCKNSVMSCCHEPKRRPERGEMNVTGDVFKNFVWR